LILSRLLRTGAWSEKGHIESMLMKPLLVSALTLNSALFAAENTYSIAFARFRPLNAKLFIADADGGNRNLTGRFLD
jgi:hypothetical protein